MSVIRVSTTYRPIEFGFDRREDLIESLDQYLPDYEVEPPEPAPGRGGGGPAYWIEVARIVYLVIPEEVRAYLIAKLVEQVAGWLSNLIRGQKEADARVEDPVSTRPSDFFPRDASHEEKLRLLETTPYKVYFRDAKGNTLFEVEQTPQMEAPIIRDLRA